MARSRKAKKTEEAAQEPVLEVGDIAQTPEAAGGLSPPPPDERPAERVHMTDVAPRAEQQAEVNPYPRVIHTANFNGYKVRLIQDQESNEMQIRFGDGTREDKPSDAVLDYVRSHRVPAQLLTQSEREKGEPVRWFNFSMDKGCWCAWMRNRPNVTRTKAEEVFDGAISIIARELGQRPEEQAPGVPF